MIFIVYGMQRTGCCSSVNLVILTITSLLRVGYAAVANLTYDPETVPSGGGNVLMSCQIKVEDLDAFEYIAWEKGNDNLVWYNNDNKAYDDEGAFNGYVSDYTFTHGQDQFNMTMHVDLCAKNLNFTGYYKCVAAFKGGMYYDGSKYLYIEDPTVKVNGVVAPKDGVITLFPEDELGELVITAASCTKKEATVTVGNTTVKMKPISSKETGTCVYDGEATHSQTYQVGATINVTIENCVEKTLNYVVEFKRPASGSSSSIGITVGVIVVGSIVGLVIGVLIYKRVKSKNSSGCQTSGETNNDIQFKVPLQETSKGGDPV